LSDYTGDVPISFISQFPTSFTPSKLQVDVINQIDKAFESGKKFVICCAPTGSGKSFIAKTLANISNAPSDAFTNLIRSYDAYKMDFDGNYSYERECKDEPAFGTFALTITKSLQDQYQELFVDTDVLKGKTNYVCDLDQNYDTELAPCTFAPTLRDTCWAENRCSYYNARNEAMLARFAVLNYKMFMSLPGHIKRKNFLICDEASELEDELIRQFSAEINYEKISNYNIPCEILVTDNRERAYNWINVLLENISGELTAFLSKANKKQSLISQFEKVKYQSLKNMHRSLTIISTHWHECEFVIDIDSKRVLLTPLRANTLSKYIFNHGEKIVLMSATIIDHKHFAASLGIRDYEYIEVESTFEPAKSPIFISSKYKLNYKTLNSALPGICEQIKLIITHHKNDKGIIHTHSNDITSFVKERLKGNSRLLCRDTNNTNEDILKIHSESVDPTILVSPSLVYGIDLKDDLARFQIIIKLPFLPLSSKRIKKLFELDSEWYENKMLNAVVQASGRATRNKDDFSSTYILDGNFINVVKRTKSKLPKYFIDRIH
jgi:ATP-dependent DNA helicase DinG